MLPIKLIQGKMKVQEQQIRQASENKWRLSPDNNNTNAQRF